MGTFFFPAPVHIPVLDSSKKNKLAQAQTDQTSPFQAPINKTENGFLSHSGTARFPWVICNLEPGGFQPGTFKIA